MKLILEGSEDQIQKLRDEFDMLIIEHGEENLPVIRDDYQTDNLWCVADVQSRFDCTDEQAMDVIEKALTRYYTMEQIWQAIVDQGDEDGLKRN
jgi:hypothetical protein